jgi:hypothetical protein
MDSKYQITTKSKLPKIVSEFVDKFFGIEDGISREINNLIQPLKRQCNFFVEYPYVDKVYRDSYYNYYSSKLRNYERNCIRISIFTKKITNSDFRHSQSLESLRKHYRGFFVVRPTHPFIIGRTVISPEALSNNNFLTCKTPYPVTSNGIKFNVEGFPYSSQDTETISCAETTLWSISEYFGYKYAEYKPLLPSTINKTLEDLTYQRLLPSRGLDVNKISYVLKDLGFGTRIYSRNSFGNEFDELFSIYVESGIPIVVAMDNYDKYGNGDFAHALLCVGREKFDTNMIKSLKKTNGYYDLDKINKKYVFIDDNHPPYQLATLSNPAVNYKKKLPNCSVNHFIAPLYPKIYLDAFKAKNYVKTLLNSLKSILKITRDVYFRFYLSSSRSYKNYIALNQDLTNDLKNLIIEEPMPKFIWVAELFTKASIKKQKCIGLVTIDATESNNKGIKPVIFVLYDKYALVRDGNNLQIRITDREPGNLFEVYKNNLNGF